MQLKRCLLVIGILGVNVQQAWGTEYRVTMEDIMYAPIENYNGSIDPGGMSTKFIVQKKENGIWVAAENCELSLVLTYGIYNDGPCECTTQSGLEGPTDCVTDGAGEATCGLNQWYGGGCLNPDNEEIPSDWLKVRITPVVGDEVTVVPFPFDVNNGPSWVLGHGPDWVGSNGLEPWPAAPDLYVALQGTCDYGVTQVSCGVELADAVAFTICCSYGIVEFCAAITNDQVSNEMRDSPVDCTDAVYLCRFIKGGACCPSEVVYPN